MPGAYRSERLSEVLRDELSKLVMKEIDVPPGTILTVSSVDLSSDAKASRIGVSIFPESASKEIMKLLRNSSGRLHYDLIRVMNIRTVPTLEFFLDTGPENAAKVEKIFLDTPAEKDKKVAKRKRSR